MKMFVQRLMIGAAIIFAVFSYGFIDPNLSFSMNPTYLSIQNNLMFLVYQRSLVAAILYTAIIALLFVGYYRVISVSRTEKIKSVPRWIMALAGILLLSYPALSYDLFNYIATAKVVFVYHENPYVVMPIEISNEPMLKYTRAANKLALYGPTWIALTSFPHLLGLGNTLTTIFTFKLFAGVFYAFLIYMIFRKTRRWDQTLFFALNPLVLIEVFVSGHNDIVMMALAIGGFLLWQRKGRLHKAAGAILFVSSVFVKGATIFLLPIFFLSKWKWEKKVALGYWLMFTAFLLSPFREEMYPWYAVWWLSLAAFIPIRKHSFIHGFSMWLSLGLMLRYVPWIATREYGGINPIARIVVTIVPVGLYVLNILSRKLIILLRPRLSRQAHSK